MIYQTITETMFKDEFRTIRPDNFSYDGLSALYHYLSDLSDDIGEPIEFDVIAICCDFSQEPIDDVLENYSLDSIEDLHDETLVIDQFDDGTVLYQVF